jgi:hypothetical protein
VRPPSRTAGGYTVVERCRRCVQHFLFSCKASPLIACILLICGSISWISCLVMLSRLRGCARHCMLTLLTLQMSAAFACRGPWILSASFPLVPAAVCAILARYVLLIGASVADVAVCLLMNACLLLVWCTQLLVPSLVATLVPCCQALPPFLPPFRGC